MHDHLRRRPHSEFDETDGSTVSPREPEVRLLVTHANREIAATLARLPADQRHVLELKFLKGFTFEGIAANSVLRRTRQTRRYTVLKELRHDEELRDA